MLLLIPLFGGCKKVTPEQNVSTQNIGVFDFEKTIRAHSRFNEVQKMEQEIAKRKAELARISPTNPENTSVGAKLSSIAAQEAAGYQQTIAQQVDAKMNEKQKVLEQMIEARMTAERQSYNQQLGEYAKELDKEYQPLILSLQLKMQTVQMTSEDRDKLKTEISSIQEQRAQKIGKQQEIMEQVARQKVLVEQQAAEEQLRNYHAQLMSEANAQLMDKQKEIEARSHGDNYSIGNNSTGQDMQQGLSELKILEDQRAKLIEIITKELKDATAKVAAGQNLEVVLIHYQQNIQAVDITDAVIAAIKK